MSGVREQDAQQKALQLQVQYSVRQYAQGRQSNSNLEHHDVGSSGGGGHSGGDEQTVEEQLHDISKRAAGRARWRKGVETVLWQCGAIESGPCQMNFGDSG